MGINTNNSSGATLTVNGTIFATGFSGDGSGLTHIGASGDYSTVGGGQDNIASNWYSTVGGGLLGTASGDLSTVGGGQDNIASGSASTVAGGVIGTASGSYSTVGGGLGNMATLANSTVGGGWHNTASGQTGNATATVGGGAYNTASGDWSTVGGGESNQATNTYTTVPGGENNIAGGQYSFAAGFQAQALHQGAFVWADSQNATFSSTANDQFLIRAQGGVGIGTASPQQTLSLNGGLNIDQAVANTGTIANCLTFGSLSGEGIGSQRTSGANQYDLVFYTASNARITIVNNGNVGIGNSSPGHLLTVGNLASPAYCDGNQWYPASDRNMKSGFEAISPREVLQKVAGLPITRWHYTNDVSTSHLGPMAQDFYAAFGVGPDDKHISTLDESSVALAAIQGLNQKVEEKDAEIQTLKQRNDSLAQRLNELEAVVRTLAEKE